MTSRALGPPRLPTPPDEISRYYMEDLIRVLEIYIQQESNPGDMRGTTLTLTQLPTSAAGLETGALYNDAGTVKIVT
jgi:hypothetical protein